MIILGFHFAGLIQNTPLSFLISSLLDPAQFQDFALSQQTIIALTGVGLAGIVISSLASQKIQWIIVTSFVLVTITIGWDFIAIYNILANENRMLATLLLSPLIFIYVLTTMEWWRGISNS